MKWFVKKINSFKEFTSAIKAKQYDLVKVKIKRWFWGMKFTDGFFVKFMIYTLLISFSYIYLYPVLFMIMNSLMGVDDLIDAGVKWIPKELYFENYVRALEVMEIPRALYDTIQYVLKVSLVTTLSSAIIGYGFARFEFPLKKVLFALMLATFILPPQVTMVSNIIIYNRIGIMNSQNAMIIPAIFGQGINAAIYILIFYQFFKTIPKALDESAQLDGASPFKVFLTIAIPLAVPAIVIVFLFSFVWTWNETFVTGLYVGDTITLPLRLSQFVRSYETLFPPGTPGAELNEAIKLAGNMVTILPVLVLYFIAQKWFTESIDRTGITGE